MAKQINPNDPLQIAKELAIEHDCLCLSLDVSQERDCMRWQCKHDHIWTAPYLQVMKTGTWCPVCEEKEKKTGKRGPKAYSRDDNCMVAEVNGYGSFSIPMNYEYATLPAIVPASQTTHEQRRPVSKPVTTELLKAAWARKNRLNVDKPIKLTKAEKTAIDRILNRIPDDTSDIFGTDDEAQHELSKEENGFLRAHMPTGWCCTEGHEWDATFNAVKVHGFGCPECKAPQPAPVHAPSKSQKPTNPRKPRGPRKTPTELLQLAKTMADSNGGECLSTIITKVTEKLTWRCTEGHEWDSTFNSVVHMGAWCQKCARKRHSDFMRNNKNAKNT